MYRFLRNSLKYILFFFIVIFHILHVHAGIYYNIYYYHGDHLGSANWITDANGDAVQYIHYAPYGELIENQIPYLYDERYKFTGKERDAESGYDFFGARFYSSIFGHWLSVDPLTDKYPHISGYAYCGWNPIKYVDTDGNSAKDKIMGWTLGSITNAIPLASLTNIRDSYTPDNPSDYNNSLQCVDNLAFCAGAALMASGAADIVGGTAIAEAGLAVATTGAGAPEGAGVAVVGGSLIGTGLLKGVIGSSLMANSSNNKGSGYSRGGQNSSGTKDFSNSRKMTNDEIGKYFNDKNWHKGDYKKSLMKDFQKELKGSTNVDLYVDKTTKQVYLKGNKSGAWVDTGETL